MSTENQDTVTLGADVGGKDADAATDEHVLALRKLLRLECQGPYSTVINEFALVLRIDGSVQSWEKCGVDNIVFRKKKNYVTADIFMPKEVWMGSVKILREFLTSEVKSAILEIEERAKKQKISISSDALNRDLDRVIEKFLS